MNLGNFDKIIFKNEEKPRQETSPREKYKSSPQEIVLGSRDFESEVKLLGGAVGDARLVKIRDDGGGVFKPHTYFEGPEKNKLISRERAAYLISRFLGFDFVPPTVIKVINGEEGSLQEFVEDAQTRYEASVEDIDQYELDKLRVFDCLVCNSDRNMGNYLIKDRKIFAIDHGFTLDPEGLQHPYINIETVPLDIAERLRHFIESEEQIGILRDLLTELLGKSIADKFIKRVTVFVESIKTDYSLDSGKFYKLIRH